MKFPNEQECSADDWADHIVTFPNTVHSEDENCLIQRYSNFVVGYVRYDKTNTLQRTYFKVGKPYDQWQYGRLI